MTLFLSGEVIAFVLWTITVFCSMMMGETCQ
jgi:hypothetical protein